MGTKIRFAIQAQDKYGDWYDIDARQDIGKKSYPSTTRTIEEARAWLKRDTAMWKKNWQTPPMRRICKQVTTFEVVE